MQVVSYAQNREDLYIASFFPDVTDGFYIDIGAHHPVLDSVTKFFYKAGWHGINVEPQKEYFRLLQKDRKRDITVNAGISDKEGSLTLREYPGGGLSTFSEKMKEEYAHDDFMKEIPYKEYQVEIVTLKTLCDRYIKKGQNIQFLKVDVEGLEYEVLKGNDWQRFRPELLCIEANHIVNDWHDVLLKNKYHKVFFDGLNEYYLAEESLHRRELFAFPKMFLAGKQIVPYEVKRTVDFLTDDKKKLTFRAEKTEKELIATWEHVHNLETLVEELRKEIAAHNELNKSIKHHTKQAVHLTKQRLKRSRKAKGQGE